MRAMIEENEDLLNDSRVHSLGACVEENVVHTRTRSKSAFNQLARSSEEHVVQMHGMRLLWIGLHKPSRLSSVSFVTGSGD